MSSILLFSVLATVVASGFGVLFAWLHSINRTLGSLQIKVSPFWITLQTKVVNALHQPHSGAEEADMLLEKLQNLVITPKETDELTRILTHVRDIGPIDAAQKAGLLLKIMPMVIEEAAGNIPSTDERSIADKKEPARD